MIADIVVYMPYWSAFGFLLLFIAWSGYFYTLGHRHGFSKGCKQVTPTIDKEPIPGKLLGKINSIEGLAITEEEAKIFFDDLEAIKRPLKYYPVEVSAFGKYFLFDSEEELVKIKNEVLAALEDKVWR